MITFEQISKKLYQDSYKYLDPDEKSRVRKITKEARQQVKKIVKTFKPRKIRSIKGKKSKRR